MRAPQQAGRSGSVQVALDAARVQGTLARHATFVGSGVNMLTYSLTADSSAPNGAVTTSGSVALS
ncbi:MAG: hypothetical protein JOY59_06430, partial [Candidatus Eremiobacteraeota bacterium]|nr:hypothetical protein [Candidatus Eremiobacteraeota bacterium]